MDPAFPMAHMALAAFVERGEFAEALAEIEESGQESDTWAWAWRAYIYGRSGQLPKARNALAKVEESYHRGNVAPDPVLWAQLGLGKRDETFAWFEKAYLNRSNLLTMLKVNPAFDPLRDDPRFGDLMRRVGLGQ